MLCGVPYRPWSSAPSRSAMILLLACASVHAQPRVPLADDVERALLPSGISHLPVSLFGELAYLFKEADGTNVIHLIGDVEISLGNRDGQQLASREAVVWVVDRVHSGRKYRQFQVMLWRDARVREVGGTVTTSPALYVTLNSTGEISVSADDVAFRPSTGSAVYQEGKAIRDALGQARLEDTEGEVSLRVMDTSGLGGAEKVKPRPVLTFQAPRGKSKTVMVGDQQAMTVTGGAFMARGVPGTGDYLEIQADSVVLFLQPPPPRADEGAADGLPEGLRGGPSRSRPGWSNAQEITGAAGDLKAEAVYLEGDVVMTQGATMIRAERLYYDFVEERALILDAVLRTMLVDRNIPLYLRAPEIRQLSAKHFSAYEARLTTSEFYTPHYHIGARNIELMDRTPGGVGGAQRGLGAGSITIRHATLNVGDHPIAYWPYVRVSVDVSETSIKAIRTGYSGDFGLELETDWNLFSVAGLETPEGFDGTLSLDYYSDRGPGIGTDVEYKRDRYFGEYRTYLISDGGKDDLGRKRATDPEGDVRGRFLFRHRQFLDDDWQLTLEFSHISDRSFLEEFFEPEFDRGKEQETLLHLKKQRDNWAFVAHLQWRILDWLTQTERLPDFSLHIIGQPIGDRLTWFSENRAGSVRFRPGDQTFRDFLFQGANAPSSTTTGRVDSRQEIEVPIDLGPLRLVPFAVVRGSAWSDSPRDGSLGRTFGSVGVRGSMYFSKVYPDYESELFDVHGVRHVVKPDITAWVSASNVDSDELHPFDENVEGIDEIDGVSMGVRQRWQTKRGDGADRRTVDFLTWDLEFGFFNDATGRNTTNGYTSFSRPENSIAHNYVNSSLIWRMNDRTAILNEINYDVNEGEVDIFNLSAVVERPPRMSYLIGYRFINDIDSNLMAFELNYRMTEKHTLALRQQFDLDRGRTLDFTVALIRKHPRWFSALSFALDEGEDDFGVSLSIWPEGFPRATLGSRRFTGLATTTRISNN